MGAEEWAVMAIRHGGLGITEGRETCRLGDKRSYGVLEGCMGPRRGGGGDNQTRSDCHHTTAQPPQLDIIVILSLLLAALSFSFSLSFALSRSYTAGSVSGCASPSTPLLSECDMSSNSRGRCYSSTTPILTGLAALFNPSD